jgi:flagellar hook-basal body protein
MSNVTIGLAGLQNTALAIDNTSNNIANANTVGYKVGEYIFSDQYFKAIDPSDANRVGQGSQRLAVRRALTYGTMQNSQNPLDMAIGGDGWFRVLSNPEDPSSMHYTRNGQFAIDKNGWIVNQNGMYLTGYQPTADKTGVSDDTRGLGTTNGKLRMPPDYANGVQTSVSKISAILDSRENAFVTNSKVAFDPTQNTFNSKTTQTIFDSNGTGHTLEVFYRRVSDTRMAITSNADGSGYSYSPGFNATPNTLQTQNVLIPKASALSIQSAPVTTLLGNVTGQTAVGTGGTTSLAFETGNVSFAATSVSNISDTTVSTLTVTGATSDLVGKTLFVNSTDTGRYVTAVSGATVTLSGAIGVAITENDTATFKGIDLPSDLKFGDKIFMNGVDTGLTVGRDSLLIGSGAAAGVATHTALAAATSFTLTGATAALVGRNVYIDGVDTGVKVTGVSGTTVSLSGPVGTAIALTGAGSGLSFVMEYDSNIGVGNTTNPKIYKIAVSGDRIDVPASASFTFFKKDLTATATATASTGASITLNATASAELVGRRFFNNGVDTGLTVSSVSGTTVFLDGALPANTVANTSANALTFKQTLDMTLLAPDGTKIVVQGTSNKQNSGTILNAVQSNLEVYASINGVFYDHSQAANTFSSKPGTPDVQTTGGYQTVAKIGLVAGRNVDSLLVDGASGKPVFSTSARLSTRVNAGSQQSTTIPLIYDLDLSDTQLQASSFVVNQSYQNGEPRSELSSVTIDGAGTIVGVYGNGRKIVAGQIALAQFDADEQLIPAGNNVFAPSYRSGTEGDNGVRIGRAGEGSFGEIKSMAVEASTVDLSNELVKLMILQRMYSANSQSIKAFDQTLRDTIQMTS